MLFTSLLALAGGASASSCPSSAAESDQDSASYHGLYEWLLHHHFSFRCAGCNHEDAVLQCLRRFVGRPIPWFKNHQPHLGTTHFLADHSLDCLCQSPKSEGCMRETVMTIERRASRSQSCSTPMKMSWLLLQLLSNIIGNHETCPFKLPCTTFQLSS